MDGREYQPKAHETCKRINRISVSVSDRLKKAIAKKARKEGHTVSSWARLVLAREVGLKD